MALTSGSQRTTLNITEAMSPEHFGANASYPSGVSDVTFLYVLLDDLIVVSAAALVPTKLKFQMLTSQW